MRQNFLGDEIMGYITAIKFAILVFPVLALVLTLPYVIVQYFKYGSVSFLRSLILFTFIFYMLCAYFLVIMPLPHRWEVGPGREVNLVPFKFIEKFRTETVLDIHNRATYVAALKQECLYVVLFNVLLTMPFGMYMKYYFKQKLFVTTVLTFCLSAFFEFTQYTGLYHIYQGSYRVCDVDDLIQNTLGGILGYILMCIVGWILPLPSRDQIDDKAYVNGRRVSGLRRTVMFAIDMVIFGGINVYVLYRLHRWSMAVVLCIFAVYYIVFPVLTHGRTPGSCITRLKLTAQNHLYIRMILRNIYVAAYYMVVPAMLGVYLVKGAKELPSSRDNKLIVVAVVVLAMLLFYLIHAICVWSTRRIYYDMWFKTAFVSTIKAGGDMSPDDASGYIPSEDGWLVKPNKKMFTNPLEFADEVREAEERHSKKGAEAQKTVAEPRKTVAEPQKTVAEPRKTVAEPQTYDNSQTYDTAQTSDRVAAHAADIDLWGENADPADLQESTDSAENTEPESITDPNYDLWAEDERNK